MIDNKYISICTIDEIRNNRHLKFTNGKEYKISKTRYISKETGLVVHAVWKSDLNESVILYSEELNELFTDTPEELDGVDILSNGMN